MSAPLARDYGRDGGQSERERLMQELLVLGAVRVVEGGVARGQPDEHEGPLGALLQVKPETGGHLNSLEL